jgi:hypothetical protein
LQVICNTALTAKRARIQYGDLHVLYIRAKCSDSADGIGEVKRAPAETLRYSERKG